MGYNTTLVVLNDALGMIEDDPHFGKKVGEAVRDLSNGRQVMVHAEVGMGCHLGAATVVETHHADGTTLVAVGQNQATLIGEFRPLGHHRRPEGQLDILRDWADRLGFHLVKKTVRKRTARKVGDRRVAKH